MLNKTAKSFLLILSLEQVALQNLAYYVNVNVLTNSLAATDVTLV